MSSDSREDERRARLAAALRENLKRRKAQARARRDDAPMPADPEAAPPPGPAERS